MTDEKLSRARPLGGCVDHNPDPERTGRCSRVAFARKRDFVFSSRENNTAPPPGSGQVAEKRSGKMHRRLRAVGIDLAGTGFKKNPESGRHPIVNSAH